VQLRHCTLPHVLSGRQQLLGVELLSALVGADRQFGMMPSIIQRIHVSSMRPVTRSDIKVRALGANK
jgi:hypothetical protein